MMIYCSIGFDEVLILKCLVVYCNIVRVSLCRLDYFDELDDSGFSVLVFKIFLFLVLFVVMLVFVFGIFIY